MRHRDLHLGYVLVEKILGLGEIFDTRTHIERLSAAIPFAQQRFADHQRIGGCNEGAHRETIDRWRSDDRQFTHTCERQLQRARDRCCTQRQYVDFRAQLLEPLLVSHTEMLLLVNDDETQVFEFDAFAEQRVGADDDVDTAVRQPLLDLIELLGGHQPRSLRNVDREAAETFGEVLEMLPRQQRCRHDHCDLLAIKRHCKRCTQRHLSLAETDVAADQAIHRPAGIEVM